MNEHILKVMAQATRAIIQVQEYNDKSATENV